MNQRVIVVDAFAEAAFTGNPAAVCILEAPRDERWMQSVAREMNLSETAFVVPRRAEDGAFDLRWFTPAVEVELCGHATLASAHVLWEEGRLAADREARFHTKSGELRAARRGALIELDFPRKDDEPLADAPDLSGALGARVLELRRNRFDFLCLLESEAAVRGLVPDLGALRRLPVRGVIVTAQAEPKTGADFVSRFFAPREGIDEDPVTGSAHCFLAPFWATRLGKTELVGHQVSARGGKVRTRLAGDRVHLAGAAITTMRGELLV